MGKKWGLNRIYVLGSLRYVYITDSDGYVVPFSWTMTNAEAKFAVDLHNERFITGQI